jgi:hypothetical protein
VLTAHHRLARNAAAGGRIQVRSGRCSRAADTATERCTAATAGGCPPLGDVAFDAAGHPSSCDGQGRRPRHKRHAPRLLGRAPRLELTRESSVSRKSANSLCTAARRVRHREPTGRTLPHEPTTESRCTGRRRPCVGTPLSARRSTQPTPVTARPHPAPGTGLVPALQRRHLLRRRRRHPSQWRGSGKS